ncbi:MAG: hypothetical protein ACI8XM_000636 [Haloarculaceae archaeon]|jgi:hypothetical protein
MTFALWLGGVFLANLVLGVVMVAAVFKMMEQRVMAGAIGGVVVGTAVIYTEATLGEDILAPTVAEMKLLVIAAALGAVLGVLGAVLVFEPEL